VEIKVEHNKHNKLTIVPNSEVKKEYGKQGRKAIYVDCICECGTRISARLGSILEGNTKSCVCLIKIRNKEMFTKHGLNNHRLAATWVNMMNRCNNPTAHNFNNYGGRGISVRERGKDIRNFIEDVYPSFVEGLTLDRIDNNGNYEKSNCKWSTRKEQSKNTRPRNSTLRELRCRL
jgi:hypothetical protein